MIDARGALCRLDQLSEGQPLGLDTTRGELIVVRSDEAVHVYENRCPHRHVSLDWAKGRFLSSDGAYLQCATHGALFRMQDGVCISGPCHGEALTTLSNRTQDGSVFLEDES